jgi:hypothetical protein
MKTFVRNSWLSTIFFLIAAIVCMPIYSCAQQKSIQSQSSVSETRKWNDDDVKDLKSFLGKYKKEFTDYWGYVEEQTASNGVRMFVYSNLTVTLDDMGNVFSIGFIPEKMEDRVFSSLGGIKPSFSKSQLIRTLGKDYSTSTVSNRETLDWVLDGNTRISIMLNDDESIFLIMIFPKKWDDNEVSELKSYLGRHKKEFTNYWGYVEEETASNGVRMLVYTNLIVTLDDDGYVFSIGLKPEKLEDEIFSALGGIRPSFSKSQLVKTLGKDYSKNFIGETETWDWELDRNSNMKIMFNDDGSIYLIMIYKK